MTSAAVFAKDEEVVAGPIDCEAEANGICSPVLSENAIQVRQFGSGAKLQLGRVASVIQAFGVKRGWACFWHCSDFPDCDGCGLQAAKVTQRLPRFCISLTERVRDAVRIVELCPFSLRNDSWCDGKMRYGQTEPAAHNET